MSSIWLISHFMLWILVIIEGVIIIALLRVFTGLHQRIEEQQRAGDDARLNPGDLLDDQLLPSLSDETVRLSQLWQHGNLLLLFVSAGCAPCQQLLTWVDGAFRNGQLTGWETCVICAGRKTQVRKLVSAIGLPEEIPVVVVDYSTLRSTYHVAGTPTIAIVEREGRVADIVSGESQSYLDLLLRRSSFAMLQPPA